MITDSFEFIQSRIEYTLVEGKQVVVEPRKLIEKSS